jgi:hypothetical protein
VLAPRRPTIAVAIVHGVGSQKARFADVFARRTARRFARLSGAAPGTLAIRGVHWAPALERAQRRVWSRALRGGPLRWPATRRWVALAAADAIAYGAAPGERRVYDEVHALFSAALRRLADDAGGAAPLCIVAHSLGTVIASDHLYDLSADPARLLGPRTREATGATPLERGETLALLFTLGSPLLLWALRHPGMDRPLRVPAAAVAGLPPSATGWTNLYDPDDPLGWPLRSAGPAYARAVRADVPVDVGPAWARWNPCSHLGYWRSRAIVERVARALAALHRAGRAATPPAFGGRTVVGAARRRVP